MSKTQTEIFNELLTEKAAQPDLVTLTSPSPTAIWRAWLWLVAFAHKLLYDAWDKTKAEIAVIAAQQITGTAPWYEGLALTWSGGSVQVDAAACRETITALQRKVIVKVATRDTGTQQLVNIPQVDLDALRIYMASKKVKGTDLTVISQAADLLWFGFAIKYTGTLLTVQAAVIQKIKDHLAALAFGADLSVTILINDLFTVPGVLDVTPNYTKLDIGLGYVTQPQNLIPSDSGYFEVGQDGLGNDLVDLIMYL